MASVSGLLSEETAFLGSCLAVRAADQEYFGGKQVYTTVVPSTSKFLDEGHCHGHSQSHDHGHGQGRVHERDHGHRHEHKHRNVHAHGHKQGYGNSHENNHEREYDHKNSQGKELIPKPDMHVVPKCELNVAIQYAKEVIAKALSGENLPHGITFIGNFVIYDIQQEVKILRKENEEIRKELAELREALEKFVRKQVIPVKESHISDVNIAEGNSVDEDFDLFGSDDEDAEKAKVVQERLKEYNEKKSKKVFIKSNKSSVLRQV
ncbi:hypothetical protein DICVIV_06198 [Dictyocaulus viviparus]|uniref:Elongation factor 1 beta central acidic region eukaryote domain-containing protein n=1 Tax=Dictyocaulus viviparus TaxID=29172 RepID=A0A0D8XZH9_DICVI|nr:hypothetical protein DICVIV_06198 [Dictyocaulus viviparus]